ncbi:coiled-coil domain-containing protein 73-like isoform X3 [Notolabrus celidotus]|uniref:coiled-coil domain-containing protein 73-like isoform X3 n=1 Tax=Notolabrus celidotus TaxID=1203425 RepID=UPI00148F952E|nr:coiled-coil domain-containing protein 73-like isoform X3 [Notolabrus celidotus]
MDLSEDSGAFHTHSTNGGPLFEPDSSLSSSLCQTGSGRTITLQLLEFKTLLLEFVEELQIQRDAKTLFEDQISKLVLEKQELEWEKESLQHQAKTMANQHTEVLMNTQKQLLKYNLEKKAVQLEQKIALQCRSKDSHLNQLGEVEKRFSALLRQCNTVKQAHEKLEQNVDDAMKMNTKLTSANGRHVSTIESLQKELAEVGDKLCKATMVTFKHDKTQNLTTTESSIQQLHLKLNMETEINKKLQKDNLAVRAEKQEVMRSLQHTQLLLLNQTQAVNKVEMELQTQKELNQALKQEHDMMQEENKAMENNAVRLMESSTVTKTSWDKKKRSLNHPNQPSPTSMEEIIGKEILVKPSPSLNIQLCST